MKIAVLSNVNMNPLLRTLGKENQVYQPKGYGNEIGVLLNSDSDYHAFGAQCTFLIMDLMELIGHDLGRETAQRRIGQWFDAFESALCGGGLYYVSDAYLWGLELAAVCDPWCKTALEELWNRRLESCCRAHENVRALSYHRLIEGMGEENAFSLKMWYMGKILLSNEAQRRLCALIQERIRLETRTPKKALLLDLDNTLWGGLAGENDHTPVELSEEQNGLAYKNLQRVILEMQRQGVLLAIVSKNNERDALNILKEHPHMLLRPETFAAKRINWISKAENIREIAEELNLGLDSFVFWDDSPAERELVKSLLPQVTAPDFPDRPEDLAPAMLRIYREYFEKPALTREDREKTAQYAANEARKQFQKSAASYEDYLKNLRITAVRADPKKNIRRLTQLLNKTNQFNLTTLRYTQSQVEELVEDRKRRVFLYDVSDRFGDNGIVAAAVADCEGAVPVIEEFVMSCRIMGKNIEYALADDIEQEMREAGYSRLRGIYLPTERNEPVRTFYDRLGYTRSALLEHGGVEYEISLEKRPKRMYYVKMRRNAE